MSSLDLVQRKDTMSSLDLVQRKDTMSSLDLVQRKDTMSSLDLVQRKDTMSSLDVVQRKDTMSSLDLVQRKDTMSSLDLVHFASEDTAFLALDESYLGTDKSKAPLAATLQHDNIDSSLLRVYKRPQSELFGEFTEWAERCSGC